MLSQEIKELFEKGAPNYDTTNNFLSLGLDKFWRRKLAHSTKLPPGGTLVDIATGTAQVATQVAKLNPHATIIGLDFSPNMLKLAQKRIKKAQLKNTFFLIGDGSLLPFAKNSFDALTVVFGIRNFTQRERALKEFYEVLKANGQLIIMEFGFPKATIFRFFYQLYFNFILPRLGNYFWSSSIAYNYFRDSVHKFPSPDKFIEMIKQAGFKEITLQKLTGGVVNIFRGIKR
ncbi:MAG: bifunctional demethylmenaquinone methyltransferase/2-methoxy-6-polyprenyl-1,4-benzoquinol methylase UbiE [Desulfobacterota bacterium]|nr:bifunctional demethylmenaquinone methyltransferase/2-methoxy-6-polyprenyl-1,4-benzoquinol methylase UbiE [Thermodesulfobacteriota bacterium]